MNDILDAINSEISFSLFLLTGLKTDGAQLYCKWLNKSMSMSIYD